MDMMVKKIHLYIDFERYAMLYQYRWAKPLDRWEGSLSQYQLWDIESKYYEGNMVNLFTNLIQPAAVSEFSRAAIPYRISGKFDSLGDKIKNDLSNRSALFRKLTGKYPKGKRNIWGEIIKKDDSYANRYFGFNNVTKDNFAQFIYEDAQECE